MNESTHHADPVREIQLIANELYLTSSPYLHTLSNRLHAIAKRLEAAHIDGYLRCPAEGMNAGRVVRCLLAHQHAGAHQYPEPARNDGSK